MALVVALVVVGLWANCCLAEIPRLRGVSISRSSLYAAGENFVCLDGGRTIKYTQLNDDYCDCEDGSDEPGTSACPNGSFYCSNIGHKSTTIPSSWVNDGVCDCCDASDEYQSSAQCVNTCSDLGKEDRLREKKKAELTKKGSQLRVEMSLKGKALKEEHKAKLVELIRSKAESEAVKQEKENIKRDAEELERVAVQAYRDVQEEERRQKLEEEALENKNEAEITFLKYDSNQNGLVELAELQTRIVFDRNRDGAVSEEEANYFIEPHAAIDLETFITIAWPRIKPFLMLDSGLFKPPTGEQVEQNDANDQEAGEETHLEPNTGAIEEEEEEEDDVGEGEVEPIEEEGEANEDEGQNHNQDYDPETQQLIETANSARNEFTVADREHREIESQLSNIQSLVDKDFGPEEEFAPLAGECFSFEDREYVYKLCPFDRASQQPRSGGSETRLGNWENWTGGPSNPYSQMMYANGAACWNGPQRSAAVIVECGLENIVSSVSEPNRCEYEFKFETPAACGLLSAAEDDTHSEQHDEL